MRVEFERGVNYSANVTHFVHGVNGLTINTVMYVTRERVLPNTMQEHFLTDIGSWCSLDQSSILSRLLCRFTKLQRRHEQKRTQVVLLSTIFTRLLIYTSQQKQLECGPMPNVMVALPNIGGAPCSTPQSLADAHC